MCPVQGNEEFCGQTQSSPTNQHGMPFQCVFSRLYYITKVDYRSTSFDICVDTGGAAEFFPSGTYHQFSRRMKYSG